jgi:hypothetical protein
MPEVPVEAFRGAIQHLHGCDSAFVEVVTVGVSEGESIWDGEVAVFDLIGHPTAPRAYAWLTREADSDPCEIVAALHSGPVDSPHAAARASVLHPQREHAKRMILILKADGGTLDGLLCPRCERESVTVRFTHGFFKGYKIWFLCQQCDFTMKVGTNRRPPHYTRDRLDKSLEARTPNDG